MLAMHYKFYWHRMLLEDVQYGAPSASVALTRLRAHVYRMVWDESDDGHVTEFGRSPYQPYFQFQVRVM